MSIDMRSKNPMTVLLESPDYGVHKAENILGALWRMMLQAYEVSPTDWRERVEKYLNNPEDGFPLEGKNRSTRKGNIDKNAAKPALTWKFLRRAILAAGITNASMSLELTHQWGTTVHDVDGICTVKDAGKSLAKFFKAIIEDLEIGPKRWLVLMETYLDNPSLGLPSKGNERNERRSSTKSALLNQSLSWNYFQQGLVFLGIFKLKLTFTTTRDGKVKDHELEIPVQSGTDFVERYKANEEKYDSRIRGTKSIAKI